ncbi:MAG: LysM peptidoglycan-binding domain-containing protein [Leadbetterella sp.]
MNKIISFLILFFAHRAYSQNITFSPNSIPTEIDFADVTFKFNDETHAFLAQEVVSLSKDKLFRAENLKKFSLFQPYLDSKLSELNLPNDFKYLALYNQYQSDAETNMTLESGVLWCFDAQKAETNGLTIDDILDERKHVGKSTSTAATILQNYNQKYNHWGLSLFAYIVSNGVYRTSGAQSKWVSKEVNLNSTKYEPIVRFLAYKYFTQMDFSTSKAPKDNLVFFEYSKGKGKTLLTLAKELAVDARELTKYNTWLKGSTATVDQHAVFVPVSLAKLGQLKAKNELRTSTPGTKKEIDSGFPVAKANPKLAMGNGGIFYTVNGLSGIQAEQCDDFVNLSYKGDLNTKLFLKYNDLTKKDPIILGNYYYLEEKKNKGEIPFHVVRIKDETTWDVSQKYGVKLDKILTFNRIQSNGKLQLGRVVYLQTTRPSDKPIEFIDVKKDEIMPVASSSKKTQEKSRVPNEEDEDSEKDNKNDSPASNPNSTAKVSPSQSPKKLISADESDELKTESVPRSSQVGVNTKKPTNSSSPAPKANTNTNGGYTSNSPEREVRYTDPVPKNVQNRTIPRAMQDGDEKIGDAYITRTGDDKYLVHEVKQGETLYRISKTYNVTIDQLYRLNNLQDNLIEIGDRIIVKRY